MEFDVALDLLARLLQRTEHIEIADEDAGVRSLGRQLKTTFNGWDRGVGWSVHKMRSQATEFSSSCTQELILGVGSMKGMS